MDAPSICFFVMMFVGFIMTFKIIFDTEKIKHQQTENENLQQENSDLIERNQKLDTYLDETRKLVVIQNVAISNYQSRKAYLIKHNSNHMLYGCFYDKKKAENYTGESDRFTIHELEIHN